MRILIRLLYYLPMEMTPDTTDFNSLSKKQLVELVIAKYNDCFRLEEENKKPKEKIELLDNENMCLNAEIKDRKEENKKLKEEIINNAKDYVKLFKKYAVTSILLLISLIMNFILIIL